MFKMKLRGFLIVMFLVINGTAFSNNRLAFSCLNSRLIIRIQETQFLVSI